MAARATFGCNNIRITKSEFVVCGKDSFPMFTYDACTIVHCTYRILVKPMKSFKKCWLFNKKIMFKFQIYFQETCFFPEAVLRIKGAQLEALSTGLDSRSTCNIPIPVSILFIVIIVMCIMQFVLELLLPIFSFRIKFLKLFILNPFLTKFKIMTIVFFIV